MYILQQRKSIHKTIEERRRICYFGVWNNLILLITFSIIIIIKKKGIERGSFLHHQTNRTEIEPNHRGKKEKRREEKRKLKRKGTQRKKTSGAISLSLSMWVFYLISLPLTLGLTDDHATLIHSVVEPLV